MPIKHNKLVNFWPTCSLFSSVPRLQISMFYIKSYHVIDFVYMVRYLLAFMLSLAVHVHVLPL